MDDKPVIGVIPISLSVEKIGMACQCDSDGKVLCTI